MFVPVGIIVRTLIGGAIRSRQESLREKRELEAQQKDLALLNKVSRQVGMNYKFDNKFVEWFKQLSSESDDLPSFHALVSAAQSCLAGDNMDALRYDLAGIIVKYEADSYLDAFKKLNKAQQAHELEMIKTKPSGLRSFAKYMDQFEPGSKDLLIDVLELIYLK